MSRSWTVFDVLSWTTERLKAKGMDSPRLDAEVLLAHALSVDRVRLYMDHAKPLAAEELARYRELVRRRLSQEPVAYLVGSREFWSLQFEVGPGVLVPRPDSETLVEAAGAWIQSFGSATLVDVGTGSGAIAVALAKEHPNSTVFAVESEPLALGYAARNIARHGGAVRLVHGDLLGAFAPASLDLIVANLPYIPSGDAAELPADVREFEPGSALFSGDDGLDHVRRLLTQTLAVLSPEGGIFLEVGSAQVHEVAALLCAQGFHNADILTDLAGRQRVVSASL